MALVLFDLDNTLLAGDSDYGWGQFLISIDAVDGEAYERANQKFYDDYKAGILDIHEFARFAFKPLEDHSMQQLQSWRQQYLDEVIRPMMTNKGQEKIDWHKSRNDVVVIITATNSFITRPIADAFGVEHLIATEPLQKNERFIAEIHGTPCYQEGKVTRLNNWLKTRSNLKLDNSWFYSDSHNDQPLLEKVTYPIAIDPDDELRELALERGWEIQSFRDN